MISLNIEESDPTRDGLERARQMLASSLKLLDDNHAPLEIGAHLDFVIHLLGEFLDGAADVPASSVSK